MTKGTIFKHPSVHILEPVVHVTQGMPIRTKDITH